MAPGSLPEVYPAFLESCLLVAAAERGDAVALLERLQVPEPESAGDLTAKSWRPYCLFRESAFRYEPVTDNVKPRNRQRVVKVVTGGR